MNMLPVDKREFMTEKQIVDFFKIQPLISKSVKKAPHSEKWYNGAHARHTITHKHLDKIGPGKYFDCDTLTDEWFKWFMKTPASSNPFYNSDTSGAGLGLSSGLGRNLFLPDGRKDTFIYFATASPFRSPDFRTITMTRKAPLLVPVYNMSASLLDFPSLRDDEKKLVQVVKNDLSRVKMDELEAKFDDRDIHGCCVIRSEPLEIADIPKDNIIDIPEDRLQKADFKVRICHGGFWLLIRANQFTPGDHLLRFKARSVNYEMDAKILINALV